MDYERIVKGTDEGVGLLVTVHIPLLKPLLAFPFDFAHQPEQHLGYIIKHLAPGMAYKGEQ